jgi:cell division protein FtsA
LIAGIVLTGGGSQLKHLKQLVEYITGMDTRIGYPNEHLAGDSDPEIASPMYATAVGLLMNAVEHKRKINRKHFELQEEVQEPELVLEGGEPSPEGHTNNRKERKSVLDKWADRLKEFLDNTE